MIYLTMVLLMELAMPATMEEAQVLAVAVVAVVELTPMEEETLVLTPMGDLVLEAIQADQVHQAKLK